MRFARARKSSPRTRGCYTTVLIAAYSPSALNRLRQLVTLAAQGGAARPRRHRICSEYRTMSTSACCPRASSEYGHAFEGALASPPPELVSPGLERADKLDHPTGLQDRHIAFRHPLRTAHGCRTSVAPTRLPNAGAAYQFVRCTLPSSPRPLRRKPLKIASQTLRKLHIKVSSYQPTVLRNVIFPLFGL